MNINKKYLIIGKEADLLEYLRLVVAWAFSSDNLSMNIQNTYLFFFMINHLQVFGNKMVQLFSTSGWPFFWYQMYRPAPATVTIIPFSVEPYAAVCDTIKKGAHRRTWCSCCQGTRDMQPQTRCSAFLQLGAQWVYLQYITKEISFECNSWLTE